MIFPCNVQSFFFPFLLVFSSFSTLEIHQKEQKWRVCFSVPLLLSLTVSVSTALIPVQRHHVPQIFFVTEQWRRDDRSEENATRTPKQAIIIRTINHSSHLARSLFLAQGPTQILFMPCYEVPAVAGDMPIRHALAGRTSVQTGTQGATNTQVLAVPKAGLSESYFSLLKVAQQPCRNAPCNV